MFKKSEKLYIEAVAEVEFLERDMITYAGLEDNYFVAKLTYSATIKDSNGNIFYKVEDRTHRVTLHNQASYYSKINFVRECLYIITNIGGELDMRVKDAIVKDIKYQIENEDIKTLSDELKKLMSQKVDVKLNFDIKKDKIINK